MVKVKAMLFTIGLMIISLIIFALAVLMFNSFQKSELTMSYIGALDRVYELDVSVQNILRNLFSSSGITLEMDDSNNFVSFEENLPNSHSTVFNISMINFKNFTESNFDYINLNLEGVVKELPLVIRPHNILYRHLNFGGRTIEIIPESINFNKYELFFTPNENISSCPAEYDETTDFDLYIQADASGTECSLRKIELNLDNKIYTENGYIYLRADSDGKLTIIANNTNTKVETRIWLNPLGNDVKIEYSANIININLTDIGISKTSSVSIK